VNRLLAFSAKNLMNALLGDAIRFGEIGDRLALSVPHSDFLISGSFARRSIRFWCSRKGQIAVQEINDATNGFVKAIEMNIPQVLKA
jgi:hypothetical protein